VHEFPFLSNDGKTHPTWSPSLDVDDVGGDPEGMDSNEEEGGDFNEKGGFSGEEEAAEDIDVGRTRRGENVDAVMRTEGQKIVEDCGMPGMWEDFGSVRNSRLEHL